MSSTVIMRSSFKDSQLPTLILMHFITDRRRVPDFYTVKGARNITIQVKLKSTFAVGWRIVFIGCAVGCPLCWRAT